MNVYNRDLSSIGTEISYSDSYAKNEQIQHGGNNIFKNITDFIIGDSNLESEGKVRTQNIIKAIEQKNFQLANDLMKTAFIPDVSAVNRQGQNLFHILADVKDQLLYGNNILIQMINHKVYRKALNVKDKQGNVPFKIAFNRGDFALCTLMEKNGASRPSDVVTDSAQSDSEQIINNPNLSYARSSVPKASIFTSQPISQQSISQQSMPDHSDDINNIVRGFKTGGFTTDSISIQRTVEPSHQILSDPLAGIIHTDIDTDAFIKEVTQKLKSQEHVQTNAQQLTGGAKKAKSSFKSGNKVIGTRKMVGFSEINPESEMFGGNSDELKYIARAATNQKNQFHEEAVEKILSHLTDKDEMTAKAIKAIIYDEIKKSKTELSGLDRAAELLKSVTKKKVDEVLKQSDLIKKIVDYLKQKNDSRSNSDKSDNKEKKTKTKGDKTLGRHNNYKFESSEPLTSEYDSSETETSD
jgi:hypothetical protein